MNDRDREEARLQEIRRRARELRREPASDTEPSPASPEPSGERRTARGPAIASWRPAGRSDSYIGGGYPGSMAYPGMMGGYPGYAGIPTPVGMPFDPGYPSGVGPIGEDRGVERHRRATWSPRVRVFDRDGTMIVRLELPGLERKEVDVRLEDQILIVEGERQDDRPHDGGRRSDWGYGPFRCEIALPQQVDPSGVTGSFRNGVLEVAVPEPRREDRRKRIKVEAA